MKRRLGVMLLMLGIIVAALPTFVRQAHAVQQLLPLTITKTIDEASQHQGGWVVYDIAIHNPNDDATVYLNSITDTLPSGFSYDSESTDGLVQFDPDINGQTLTWNFDGEHVNGGQTVHLFFEAGIIEGEPSAVYCNQASVLWDESSASTGLTAPVGVDLEGREFTCAQPTQPVVVRSSTPTRTATARATATVVAPTKTPAPQSTVLAEQATPKPKPPAALPRTGSGSGSSGTNAWVLVIAATLIVSGAGLTLAGRKRA